MRAIDPNRTELSIFFERLEMRLEPNLCDESGDDSAADNCRHENGIPGREGGVPEWSTGSPSSKGPSIGGLFGGVTSPIFTNDFRLCPADARENTPLLPVK